MIADPAAPWAPLSPWQAREILSPLSTRWWIAGGWALDLFLGRQGRTHKDLDVGILRREVREVLGALPGWEFFEAQGGRLSGPVHAQVRADVNGLWGRRVGTEEWALELMLEDAEGQTWVFRRDRRVRRALEEILRWDAQGIPYLAPEMQLLYKAGRIRPQDQGDFERVLARLDAQARHWLCATLEPSHPWVPALRGLPMP